MDVDDALAVEAREILSVSEQEFATAKTLVGVAASLSLVSSVVMMACFLLFQESRRGGRRVLFCLHLADAGASVAWLLTLALPEVPKKTEPLCYTQSYLLVFFILASHLWTACFAFHLYQILGRRSKYPELYEHRYHLLAWGIPATTVLQLGLQQLNGFALLGVSGRPWCWFRSWSHFEWSPVGFHVQLLTFYVPVLLVFLHNLATYIALLYRLNDVLSTRMEDRIWRRMMAYSWVFFLAVIWSFFAFLYQAFSTSHELSTAMLYLMSFFSPLQGAMNSVAYGYNTKIHARLQTTIRRVIHRCR